MNKLINFIIFSLALAACSPAPTVEGGVISSRELGKGFIEHLVRTDSPHIPFYILRTNKKELQKGAKIMLELHQVQWVTS